MIAPKTIDATIPKPQITNWNWKSIPWNKVIAGVRRLQLRIAKAWKQGDRGKIKDLQRLLERSFYAKLLAVKRVTSNRGCNTPGIDKILWKSPTTKLKAATELGKGKFKPSPLRRLYIPKKNGKKRPLSIPTMLDRATQALHLLTIEPIAESTADGHSYGFRPCRSTADAIEQCFIILSKKTSAQYVLEGDIKACFDEISHPWLQENIPMNKGILGKLLKAGFMENNTFHDTVSGVPQGGVASATCANMALDGIAAYLNNNLGKRLIKHKVHIVRYADDFIVTANSSEFLENEIKPQLAAFFKLRGLRLSEEKTVITHIEKGFNFLGQTVRKFGNKLIIKPSNASVKTFLGKIREICSKNKQAKTEEIIFLINPIIRGWANYHKHVVSSKTFKKVDCKIHRILWKWAKRRHPKKSLGWIKNKYYKPYEGKNWIFNTIAKDGIHHLLLSASQTKIKRHIKIRHDANPFDEKWEIYFERRMMAKSLQKRNANERAKYLLKSQNNVCPLCMKRITPDEDQEFHFKQAWILGGSTQDYNLTVVHTSCHEMLHAK
jgi:RNA-directed DNA polymerase